MPRLARFLAELKRRRVYHVGVVYAAAAFVAAQAADIFLPRLGLPDWTVTAVVVLAVAGFPVAVLLGWAFDITPTGVQRTDVATDDAPPPGTWRVAGATALATLVLVGGGWWLSSLALRPSPQITSLAVLPLQNLMGDPAQDYFVDGMHDALTAELAKIGALAVISRTSTMRYRGTDKPMSQIARELGVQGLIEGSVLRGGDQVRITVQLIHGPSDRHLWADSYHRELRGILVLQGEVAQAIAREVQVVLSPEQEMRLAEARPVDPAAYEDYLKGLYEWNKLTPAGWEAAVSHFERSIARDASYAPAHAMMSSAYSMLGYYSRIPPALLHSRGLSAAERAVALDPSLAEAHASLALVKLTFDWDWIAADRASHEALRLNPNSPKALMSRAFFLSWTGRHDEAISVGRRAIELDPVAPYSNTWLGWYYFMARRYDDAIAQVSRVLELEPDYQDAHLVLLWCYIKKGMYDEAFRTSEAYRTGRQLGERTVWVDAWLLALTGRPDEARNVIEQLDDLGYWGSAIVYAELGETDRAFALLEQAYQTRQALMSVLKVDPRMDALRHDLRFAELLSRMEVPD